MGGFGVLCRSWAQVWASLVRCSITHCMSSPAHSQRHWPLCHNILSHSSPVPLFSLLGLSLAPTRWGNAQSIPQDACTEKDLLLECSGYEEILFFWTSLQPPASLLPDPSHTPCMPSSWKLRNHSAFLVLMMFLMLYVMLSHNEGVANMFVTRTRPTRCGQGLLDGSVGLLWALGA